jgi:hypothetical protein
MKTKKQHKIQTEIESEIQDVVIEETEQPKEPEINEEINQQPEPEPEQKPTEPEPEPEQKKKRGRPKKTESKKTSESPNVENEIFATEDEYKEHQQKEQQQKEQQQKQQEPEQQKSVFGISGEMLLGAIDFTFPVLINLVGGFIEPELKKIPASQFMLAEEERKTLLPAAEAVAKENVRLSPVEMLIGGLLIVYTGKIYQAVNEIKTRK